MTNNIKFTIYYKPVEADYEHVKSLTLAFSRLNINDNTYKQKLVLEYFSPKRNQLEEYKMKEFHLGAVDILNKIDFLVDFDKEYPKAIKDGKHDYFFITYGDKCIETSDKKAIQKILDSFNFDGLLKITHKHYKYIKDMNEYTELMKLLDEKMLTLDANRMIKLANIFKTENPYRIFQSMGWLNTFLDETHIID